MARLVDVDHRAELLDAVVGYLAQHGLANVSLRPMAHELGVSVNALVHHFGSKDDLIVAALRRSETVQQDVESQWLERRAHLSQADLLRAWWRWITASPQNLAVVRLGIEAAALDATVTGLPRQVRGDQIGIWRSNIEQLRPVVDVDEPRHTASGAHSESGGVDRRLLLDARRATLADDLDLEIL